MIKAGDLLYLKYDVCKGYKEEKIILFMDQLFLIPMNMFFHKNTPCIVLDETPVKTNYFLDRNTEGKDRIFILIDNIVCWIEEDLLVESPDHT